MKSILPVLFTALFATAAQADVFPVPSDAPAIWRSECSSCHIAYPPQLLAKPAWRHLMGGLDKHFGDNAKLAPADVAAILAFLERYGATDGKRFSSANGRISETRWFLKEHSELPATAFRTKAVGSVSNCAACHARAEQGSYRERELLGPAQDHERSK